MFLTGNQFPRTRRKRQREQRSGLVLTSWPAQGKKKKKIFSNWELFVLHWLKFYNSYGKLVRGRSRFWKRTATTQKGHREDYWTRPGSKWLEILQVKGKCHLAKNSMGVTLNKNLWIQALRSKGGLGELIIPSNFRVIYIVWHFMSSHSALLFLEELEMGPECED